MIYNIELGYSPYVKLAIDGNTIVLPNENMKLLFTSKTYTNLTLKVFCRINGKVTVYNVTDGQVLDITELLKAGTLELEITHLIKGKVVKRWEVHPVVIIEETPHFVLKDMLHSLEKRSEALEKQHEVII